MSIANIRLVNIMGHRDDLDPALERFVKLNCFHPAEASKIVDRVHGLTAYNAESPCNRILKELDEIEDEFDFCIHPAQVDTVDYTLEKIQDYVSRTHKKLRGLLDQKKNTRELIKKYKDALVQVKNIEALDVSLDDIFSCDYVYARVGRLPIDSIDKLKFYRSRPFIFKSFSTDEHYSWCMYFTTNQYEREVDNIFSSLFFERIHIPDFVHGTPEKAEDTLEKEIDVAEDQLKQLQEEIQDVLVESEHDMGLIKGELLFLDKINKAKRYVVGLGDKFQITGFIDIKDEDRLMDKFSDVEDKVDIEIHPADSDKRLKPPTKLKNNWFTRPFSMFVDMYGTPDYSDIDPTPFVAVTYMLLFGIMFGDLGQGLLLALIGYLLYRYKGMVLGAVGVRIGLSAAFFGLLYGSVFGNEEILTPLYTDLLGMSGKPIHVMDADFTMTLIYATVGIGAALIAMSIAINVFLNIKKKRYGDLVFSHNGIAGLIFYMFVLIGAALMMLGGINIFQPVTIAVFVAIPLVMIFFKEPFERLLAHEKPFPTGFGGFFAEGFFELFEVMLSYLTNTMSFLRVGGFVLAHAGMMLVVFSLMEMSGGAVATTLIFVFGNLFVMALEGLIVGIQVLRLEFYEMFSRYYEGDGIKFETF